MQKVLDGVKRQAFVNNVINLHIT